MAPRRGTKSKKGPQAPPPAVLKLTCLAGPSKGTIFKKPGASLTIGRTSKSKIWVKDPSVSEKHAKLDWDGRAWFLQDVGSSNGTRVNGIELEAEGDPRELKVGDIVLLGDESKLQVDILPVASEEISVEEYLQAECVRIEQRLQARLEQLSSELQEHWRVERSKLLAEASCA